MRALYVLVAAGALLVQPRIPVCAQVPGISFWAGARADLIGVRGLTGSPALFGADVMLLRRFGGSPLEVGLALSASRRDQGQHTGSTFGLYSELRYGPTRAYGPYSLDRPGSPTPASMAIFSTPLRTITASAPTPRPACWSRSEVPGVSDRRLPRRSIPVAHQSGSWPARAADPPGFPMVNGLFPVGE